MAQVYYPGLCTITITEANKILLGSNQITVYTPYSGSGNSGLPVTTDRFCCFVWPPCVLGGTHSAHNKPGYSGLSATIG